MSRMLLVKDSDARRALAGRGDSLVQPRLDPLSYRANVGEETLLVVQVRSRAVPVLVRSRVHGRIVQKRRERGDEERTTRVRWDRAPGRCAVLGRPQRAPPPR